MSVDVATSKGVQRRRAWRPRNPEIVEGESFDAVAGQVRAILAEHGEDSLSPYVLNPAKRFVISGEGLVAFTVIRDTVVISADPVGRREDAIDALTELVHRARRAHLSVVCFGASERYLDSFTGLGMRAIRAGEEAVVAPDGFTLDGRDRRKLRQSVNRVERRGWELSLLRGREVAAALEAEIAEVEARWRDCQPRLYGFAMGMGQQDLPIGADDVFVIARSPEGELRGVLRLLANRGKLSLDTMRRVGETPNGLNEALVVRALEHAREAAIPEVSLNYAGLSHLVRPEADHERIQAKVAVALLPVLRRWFQLDRIVMFNQKFGPSWRPRFLVYDGRRSVVHAARRAMQAEGRLR